MWCQKVGLSYNIDNGVYNLIKNRKKNNSFYPGFTLAEVLITLGIIGVVAAMTIPALMQNIQDRQFKEAAKEAYSKASQAVQLMKNDNGGDLSYYYSTYKAFKPDFMKYFKVAQDCGDNTCVPYTTSSTIYKTFIGVGAYTWTMANGQFITTDGMFWGVENEGTGTIRITVDINGYQKSPNVFGRDVFIFELVNDVLLPEGSTGTVYSNNTYNGGYCKRSKVENDSGISCMDYVMRNIDY